MKISDLLGYAGIITVNSAALLPIILIIANIQTNISIVITICLLGGLMLLGIRSIIIHDRLQVINCTVGASLNLVLLALLQ